MITFGPLFIGPIQRIFTYAFTSFGGKEDQITNFLAKSISFILPNTFRESFIIYLTDFTAKQTAMGGTVQLTAQKQYFRDIGKGIIPSSSNTFTPLQLKKRKFLMTYMNNASSTNNTAINDQKLVDHLTKYFSPEELSGVTDKIAGLKSTIVNEGNLSKATEVINIGKNTDSIYTKISDFVKMVYRKAAGNPVIVAAIVASFITFLTFRYFKNKAQNEELDKKMYADNKKLEMEKLKKDIKNKKTRDIVDKLGATDDYLEFKNTHKNLYSSQQQNFKFDITKNDLEEMKLKAEKIEQKQSNRSRSRRRSNKSPSRSRSKSLSKSLSQSLSQSPSQSLSRSESEDVDGSSPEPRNK